MPSANSQLKEIEKSLDDLGIVNGNADILNKAEEGTMTTDNTTFGGLLPREFVEQMIVDIYDQSGWLKEVNRENRVGRKGIVPIYRLSGHVSVQITEDQALVERKRGTTEKKEYDCKSFGAIHSLTMQEMYEARAAGLAEFEEKVRIAHAVAIGNDIANLVMNGYTSTPATHPDYDLLKALDGVRIKSELGNVLDSEGVALEKKHFAAMLDHMPNKYANDPGLRWMMNSRTENHWSELLENRLTNLGDAAIISKQVSSPKGKPILICDHIEQEQGPTAIAPTSVADNTTYVQFVLTTLVTALHVASAAAGVGRYFKVTNKTTGVSEICVGILDTTLRINTVGLLGQTTVSTTASDYTVGLCDETDIYLMNPKGITVVNCYDMASYRIFRPEYGGGRYDFYTYYHLDTLIPLPEAIVKYKRVGVTPITV
jgi:HK97 family phage major capsid protein